MNNKAKVYTLYFAIQETITSICSIVNYQDDSRENLDSSKLLDDFLSGGMKQYSHLKYELNCGISLANFNAEQELYKLKDSIEHFLGELDSEHLDLVFPLWIGYNLALDKYFFVFPVEGKLNLSYEQEKTLILGQQKYVLSSSDNSTGWENIDSIVKSKLGDF